MFRVDPWLVIRWSVLALGIVTLGTTVYASSLHAIISALTEPFAVVQQGLVHQWSILVLCVCWLWVKRQDILVRLERRPQPAWQLAGALAVAVSLLLTAPSALFVGAAGLFALAFGKAARIPFILMAIYLAVLAFFAVTPGLFGAQYAALVTNVVSAGVNILGVPIYQDGPWLALNTLNGETFNVSITAECAGPVTLGVFMGLFALMTLDTPLPKKSALVLFLVGVAGTMGQSLARLVLLLLVGRYQGADALWTAHTFSTYVVFGTWVLAFCALYLIHARSLGLLSPSRSLAQTRSGFGV